MTLAFRASWCQDLFFQVTSSIQSTAPSDVLSPESVSILKMHLIIKKKSFCFCFLFFGGFFAETSQVVTDWENALVSNSFPSIWMDTEVQSLEILVLNCKTPV